MEAVFWLFMAFILYTYAGYPLMLLLVSAVRSKPGKKQKITPPVSFIIAAHNEEKGIREKIENTLKQDYPGDRLEIIVASDCSDDRTDNIVEFFSHRNVKLVRAAERRGKEHAQHLAVRTSQGAILIFSDVATILEPSGVSAIVSNFADPEVGCVSSIDRFVDKDGKTSGEGAYVRYEMFLRKLESRVNSLVGLSGSFFAARRDVCLKWSASLQSDFNTLFNCIKLGLRGIADPESIGYYRTIADGKKEYERKVRTVVRGISVFFRSTELLNPVRYGLFSWQLFSHKMCRWLVPFALAGALFSNFLLTGHSLFWKVMLVIQAGFYTTALAGMLIQRFAAKTLIRVPAFFVLANLSILKAWALYLSGKRIVTWEPSKRGEHRHE